MRILRLTHNGTPSFASLENATQARLYTDAPWCGGTPTQELVPFDERALLTPVTPSKIVCVGRNYRAHAAELGNAVPTEPLLFLKPPTALLAPHGTLEWPAMSERVEYEGELGVVISTRLKNATREQAASAIFGYTICNDVTARDLQRKETQFTRAKGFDTFCPCGPWIETDFSRDGTLSTTLNGERKQHGKFADMVFDVETLLAFISNVMTLEPGDLVLTGTPEGVGPMKTGDECVVSIDGIGSLRVVMGAQRTA